jgi:hypothetical protein
VKHNTWPERVKENWNKNMQLKVQREDNGYYTRNFITKAESVTPHNPTEVYEEDRKICSGQFTFILAGRIVRSIKL